MPLGLDGVWNTWPMYRLNGKIEDSSWVVIHWVVVLMWSLVVETQMQLSLGSPYMR